MTEANDLRVDIRSALEDVISWMENAGFAVERLRDEAETRTERINFKVIGNLIGEADRALHDLDQLVEALLKEDIPLDSGLAATALAFYADERNHRAPRGQVSPAAKDGGLIARTALSTITDGGEGGE